MACNSITIISQHLHQLCVMTDKEEPGCEREVTICAQSSFSSDLSHSLKT